MTEKIKVIAFDADDTLWINETFFREAEQALARILSDYGSEQEVVDFLFKIETSNIPLFGYGIKGFTLSMIQSAIEFSEYKITAKQIESIIYLSKEMVRKPVELLDGVEEVLKTLQAKGYKMVVATKGDLLDQQRKLKKSNLESYFHHIEVMSDKQEDDYFKLIQHLDIKADEFLMIGNSIKSDVIPVLNLGGMAFHVPFHTTWQHEVVDSKIIHPQFKSFHMITDILAVL
ncbi:MULTISPECIES: HAD family hydrolase [unclassified Lentimicrobium]|uniref:HAD family hydrolase n=1 Tax=unclassified Lentimicrobium TaxID=2677434 RepID=UPI00155568A4|nr:MULTISPECIES: HAD family hydrolase [unclassified Lentimicrobium]NPD45089.1 HAD family hydrolase [Lentimicrobium sp. S6]NPD86109.1 HAD family hydrolase [Lentimicrobium sp. L6]